MPDTPTMNDLLLDFQRRGPIEQRQVAEFVRSLVQAQPGGTPGADSLRFAGSLSDESARELEEIIQEGCERIHPDAL